MEDSSRMLGKGKGQAESLHVFFKSAYWYSVYVGVHGDVSELLIKMKRCSDAMNHAEVIVKIQPQSSKVSSY